MTSLRTFVSSRLRTGPVVRVVQPLRDFLATEAASGVLLVVAAVAAMVWANSPWKGSYESLWSSEISLRVAGRSLVLDLRHWVNDGLMTLFFFVVGLEIKREVSVGELKDPRRAALPALAALGGMVVPALMFVAVNLGGTGVRGWGIPMATDIAMALGVLALIGSRVHPSLKLFLLALAIVDDIGAIVVIAVFYSKSINVTMLVASVALIVAVVVAKTLGVSGVGVYVVLGTLLWFTVHEAGVHATIAGVILGLLAPTTAIVASHQIDEAVLADVSSYSAASETVRMARQSVSVVEWLEHRLHPWTSYAIVPIFAFANAGISISFSAVSAAASSRITLGVILGLVVGKTVGITVASWVAVRTRVAILPDGLTWGSIVGVASLAGIGFTVSLFVAGLAYDDAALDAQAKMGILAATVAAALLGTLALRFGSGPARDEVLASVL